MENMLKIKGDNPLLVKSDLGRSRPATFTLPGDDFTYGNPNIYQQFAVKQCKCSNYTYDLSKHCF